MGPRKYAAQVWANASRRVNADPDVEPLLKDVQIKDAHRQGLEETRENRMKKKTKDGIFVYFDSLPLQAWGHQTARMLEEELPKMPIWRKNSVFFSQVGKGSAQGSKTNDCGIFTCLYASAYLVALFNSKFFERKGLNLESKNFCLLWEMATCVEKLGRLGREHIEITLQKDAVDFTHKALSKGLRLNVLYS